MGKPELLDPLTFDSMYSLLTAGMKLLGDLEKFLSPFGLSQGRLALLLALKQANGKLLSPSSLAKITHKSRPTVTRMIQKLKEDQLLKESRGQQDGRSKSLLLTHRSEQLLEKIIPGYNHRIQTMACDLQEREKKDLMKILSKITFPGDPA